MGSFSADQLRILARIYCGATGTKLTALGERAASNDRLFFRLLDGHGCTLEAGERASRWFADNWPNDVAWPEGVPVRDEVAE